MRITFATFRIASLMALCATALLAPPRAAADTVDDVRGTFSSVEIVALDDADLIIKFPDGRTLKRAADTVKSISLDAGRDAAADELTRAELLRRQGKRRDAIALYQRVLTLSKNAWVVDYANMRLVRLHDDVGELFKAYEAYCRLAVGHPRLAEKSLPRKIPRADSKQCRELLADIEARLAKPQPEGLSLALKRIRAAVLREPAPVDPSAADPTAAADTADTEAPPTTRPSKSSIARSATRGSRPPTPSPLPTEKEPSEVEPPHDVAPQTPKSDSPAPPATTNPKPGPTHKQNPDPDADVQPEPPRPDPPLLTKAREALKSGDLAAARQMLADYRQGNDVEDAAALLFDAELLLAGREPRRAGIQAMKIVIQYPRSARVPAALLLAGEANEQIGRRAAALKTFQRCTRHPAATDDQRRAAQARIDDMHREAAAGRTASATSRPAEESPGS